MQGVDEVGRVLTLLTRGQYLMTAAFQFKRTGVVVRWVQPCAETPPMVCIAIRNGHSIHTVIRDSRCFALCRIEDDPLVTRKFAADRAPEHLSDPFDCLDVERLVTGAPVLKRAGFALDCEVVRHLDLEADHSLYIGRIVGARCGCTGVPGASGVHA